MADSQDTDLHLTVNKDIAVSSDRVTMTITYQGEWEKLLAKAKSYKIGQTSGFENDDIDDIEKAQPSAWQAKVNVKCTDCRISRMNGGRGTLTATIVGLRNLSIWSLDFSEVSKDIHTWMADAVNGQGEPDNDARPDLAIISAWERLRDSTQDVELYRQFKYYDGTNVKEIEKDTSTYKLAEMIINGIESYTIYIPVVTKTSTSFSYEDLRPGTEGFAIGANWGGNVKDSSQKQLFDELGDPTNLFNDCGRYYKTDGNEVERQWFKTADTISCNGDGSFTQTERWSGVDSVSKYLYKNLSGADDA